MGAGLLTHAIACANKKRGKYHSRDALNRSRWQMSRRLRYFCFLENIVSNFQKTMEMTGMRE